jgi:hypothetical protein
MSANNVLGGEEEEAKVLVIALLLVAAIEAVASPYGGCSLAADSSMKRHTSRSNRIDLASASPCGGFSSFSVFSLPFALNFSEEETLTSSLRNLDTLDNGTGCSVPRRHGEHNARRRSMSGGRSETGDELRRVVARATVTQALEAVGFDCAH